MNFEDFRLSQETLKSISELGFEEPTPIQVSAIPILLSGKDLVGQAQTGTGKTAAFAIPIAERSRKGRKPFAIILEPTRELAVQVSQEMYKIGKHKKISVLPIYGGTTIERQIKTLQRGVNIIVGTPGRVIDLINRKVLSLSEIKIVVLDEADEMLDMGFLDIPENDEWWGKGFTEWTNVTKAEPLFDGHLQPHLPGDFGFYDLRVREARRDQINMAKQYGVEGFCYHYYWFSGTRILNRPLDDMLADRESDMPFCLCWANENWTRRWDEADHEVLIAQKYLPDDDLNFIKSLVPFFKDGRYIRVDGKPFLIVYRPQHLPDARKTAKVEREYCRSMGLGEIHISAALTHGNED